MIYTRLFEYDSSQESNAYRGTDYTRYIMLGDTNEDKLNEVLGTVELTLAGLPRSEEFTPKTKFIYEVWQGEPEAEGSYLQSFHVIVQEDLVTKPILSDDNYYDHHLTFVEASAIAQSYVVDNIAVTYKLNDITLDAKTAIDLDLNVTPSFEDVTSNPSGGHFGGFYINNNGTKKEYSLGKRLVWDNAVKSQWGAIKYYQSVPAGGTSTITIPVPMLEILNGRSTSSHSYVYEHLGYCSLVTTVVENNVITGAKEVVSTTITNPARTTAEAWNEENNWDLNTTTEQDKEGRILEGFKYSFISITAPIAPMPRTVKVAEYENSVTNRQITIQLRPNCVYSVTTTLKSNFAYYSHGYAEDFLVWKNIKNDDPSYYTNNGYPVASMTIATYSESDYGQVMFWHAPDANAYELFQKAQITTQNVRKVNGVPINETEQTFYLAPEDKLRLQNTKIVENFYNQKNFWEILLDIGKYIHSIPKIRFGGNDRFVVTWRQLGDTQQRDDATTQISIFNSRSMENYIAACTSYVTNMVQLGGVIDEWVAPKSSSEDYLVYNDVAEIKTSKPIIEIVKMEVKCVNNNYNIPSDRLVRDLTPANENGYVFEENVYNCLGIDWVYTPNNQGYYDDVNWARVACKGFAIYYGLGTNIIKGLNYQLPTKNTGDYPSQYAIKNILGVLFQIGLVSGHVANATFNAWNAIKVNDFVFHIVYRTKDTVRSDQTRPDFKKYLLSSKFDRVPQHNQFNNQTDIVCDSVKFGNNVYGKLIRTGNTEYTTTEWCDNLQATRNVGELYNIRGELYYVSTVKNTNYKTHIISEVTFSKDYNQLSEIIGIPSEPRFYEISEQSLIDREVALNDYIVLGTKDYSNNAQQYYCNTLKGWEYIGDLLFHNEKEFPKYAITVFKNDADKKTQINGNETFYKEIATPINTYSVQNSLTMEWDMEDNFSAGDKVIETTDHKASPATVDNAYNSLFPVRYTDVYGRSDLMDFVVLKDIGDISADEIRALPESPYRLRFTSVLRYVGEATFATTPDSTDLDQFVLDQTGTTKREGDGILWVRTIDGVEDGILYFYNGYSWDIYRNVPLSSYEIELIRNGEINWDSRPLLPSNTNIVFSDSRLTDQISKNTAGIGLLKDNREALHINLNIQMITESDEFVLSSCLWQPEKGTLKLALLKNEINKISNDTISTDNNNIISDEYIIYAPNPNNPSQYIDNTVSAGVIIVRISSILSGVDLTGVKALAIVSDNLVDGNPNSGAKYFVMGRNITGLSDAEAKADWYISNYDKNMFPHQ